MFCLKNKFLSFGPLVGQSWAQEPAQRPRLEKRSLGKACARVQPTQARDQPGMWVGGSWGGFPPSSVHCRAGVSPLRGILPVPDTGSRVIWGWARSRDQYLIPLPPGP